ncbi:M20/M25/M40 family metallo-hydrolase [Fluoribacter dumoffii]|uniref:M20/M25/M40 family metallo-hydrolase n=1 Tax=Fluoribacter dumoffii TaxID=463 RepID=UPI00026C7C12|nr:M20/M25/M40 family metallo-hydrolase [Fluoribacter dumoffii]MCW8386305.1 M20/M25/M40 family metallo-hydrolase [Fluoribacter dumoffii]MCW8419358.1 M20/M25/M40 family metallo-hydrolase [Fluoribacter dumoffii]MCW8452767.1 M20/M25/M40 family metallo-hydrolase [Fluoribacter dumoffii]MCW8459983.1 M20/M25/M40 family metallo-hydrolase [Fluoribacter dumoffii]MCW8483461.1 M20/M25/M40 family metallo-hydrolase [Fluoribacter dumoffii]
MRKLIWIFLLLFEPMANAGGLSPVEANIAQNISTKSQEQLSLLERLVNINSGTTNLGGIQQVGAIVHKQFTQLGFKTYWYQEPPALHRAGTLIAHHRGNKGKKLLLIGHLDTVFPANSSFQHFKRTGNSATGPGIIDDKGGLVVILYALKALQEAKALENANITVVLTGDEEDAGKPVSISRKPLIDAAKESDIALDFEWAITSDTATVARRGITLWNLEVHGNEGHSSEIFQKKAGYGAIYELVRILNTMRIQLGKEHFLSFNPGFILGGTTINKKNDSQGNAFGKENVIAKIATANGDLRFITEDQKNDAERKIEAIVANHLPGTTASIKFQDAIPSMAPTAGNEFLLRLYSDVSEELGQGMVLPLDPGARGAGDISHIASMLNGTLSGLGPVGTGGHSVKETLDIPSLTAQTQRAALLIYRLINQ